MKSKLFTSFSLSVCGLMLASAAMAATPQPTASPDTQHDAQHGEIAKSKDTAPAAATPATGETPTETTTKAGGTYSDDELKNFVNAAKEVDQVKVKYEGKLSATKAQPEIDKIKKEADAELNKAVEAKGMSVEQYNQIHQAALKDPQLLARIQKYM